MPEVSPEGGAVLCQGESGSGASLGAAIAKSDRTFRRPCDGNGVQRRLLCAEQEFDLRCAGSSSAEDGVCAWWRSPGLSRGSDLEREKGIRWMPWHQEAMKDVARCEKPRGAASRL